MRKICCLLWFILYSLTVWSQGGITYTGSGSGFAIGGGYLVTNYHVVEGSNIFYVCGVNGNINKGYFADVVVEDRSNDLAILLITDEDFKGYGTVPYSIKWTTEPKASEVFALGYPLTTTMGIETKYNKGSINSLTGFQGEVSNYQIDVPIQPGNSGGPLFNTKGEIVGIVVASHKNAQNVNYAVKASCLKTLADTKHIKLPTYNTLASLSRVQQVEKIERFTYLILCAKGGSPQKSSAIGGGSSSTHQYVNLGLPSGTLWATTNIGASNPEDYGDYFAWGETSTKSTYSWSNYKYGDYKKFTKYCNKSDYGYNGFTDSRTTLEKSDDVAYQKWGSDWCMPTSAQFKELKDKCTWTWTSRNGKNGYNVKGPNGNSIFLPAAGSKSSDGKPSDVGSYGLFWSSSLYAGYPSGARLLNFGSSIINPDNWSDRTCGYSVRPVRCRN